MGRLKKEDGIPSSLITTPQKGNKMADSLDNNTEEVKVPKTTRKTKNEIASLIPQAESYFKHNLNVMLIGLHGTGKTVSIQDLCEKFGVKYKYFSCSTMDPYTDLVGVPVPMSFCEKCRDYYSQEIYSCPSCKSKTVHALKPVRPREIDEVEFIFWDEFNRGDPKLLNAVFEIIQFKSINGEKLPNLKCSWAAMNPPDHEYHVEPVDPALLDRFDVYIEIKPKPSVAYMVHQGIPTGIAHALKQWWDEQNRKRRDFESYISPRRLEKIGMVYFLTGNPQSIKDALPKAGTFDVKKLVHMLEQAVGKRTEDYTTIGKSAADFNYNPGGLLSKKTEISKYLNDHPEELETHNKIVEVFINSNLGAETMIRQFSHMLDALTPTILEGFIQSLPDTKKQKIKEDFANQANKQPNMLKELKNLKSVLDNV